MNACCVLHTRNLTHPKNSHTANKAGDVRSTEGSYFAFED
jgi:hypothetical protein